MQWSEIAAHESKFRSIWDKKGGITWKTRVAIGNAVDGFIHDDSLKGSENLTVLMARVAPEIRESLDAEIGLKRTAFYGRLKSGLDEEQKIGKADSFDDYMQPAVVKTENVDIMDLDGAYDVTPNVSIEETLNFLDNLAASIKGQ